MDLIIFTDYIQIKENSEKNQVEANEELLSRNDDEAQLLGSNKKCVRIDGKK